MYCKTMESYCYNYTWFPSQVLTLITTIITFFFCFSSSTTATQTFSRIYAFGDSYTDTGNTKSSTGPTMFQHVSNLPYGTTFFNKPTNRYSDGRLVIDFVAETLNLPYLPPFLDRADMDTSHGVNFAVAGSTAIDHEFFVRNNLTVDNTPESLKTELLWFDKFLEEQGCGEGANTNSDCSELFDDTLFWVGEIGVNDYAYLIGSLVPTGTVQKLAIDSLSSFLEELLKKGAKYMVVQGLPSTGCLALSMSYSLFDDRDDMGCVGSVNLVTYMHNSQLQDKIQDLRKQFPNAVITYADYSNAYREVMKNTRKYGFQEPFEACCGSGGGPYNFNLLATCGSPAASRACSNPSQFINWDGVHLTEAMYKVIADLFLHGGYCHPSFSDLLSRKTLGS
ncbi:GDSL esterase/lipase At3g48460 isoform X1 [Telopea speciosissima]|uniref:GDSL esterase/lipase At3g48460 isoform X1 n=1 Tax=Telopea speciosissima TaxID=54955 RepID=UPI001CC764E8|nr:GDSL esterase/lipase At3g48460 isoform X1 [Telopea speciosissima]